MAAPPFAKARVGIPGVPLLVIAELKLKMRLLIQCGWLVKALILKST
jgi:hypothetical protein